MISSNSYGVNRARAALLALEKKWPELETTPREQRYQLQEVLNVATMDNGNVIVAEAFAGKDHFTAVLLHNVISAIRREPGVAMQFLHQKFDGSEATTSEKIPLEIKTPAVQRARLEAIQATARSGRSIYIGGPQIGILRLDADKPEFERLAVSDRLPAHLQSLVCMGDTLYAGLERGTLVRISADGASFETVFSSEREDEDTELDNRSPFSLPGMVHDKLRKLLLLVVLERARRKAELWSWSPATMKCTLISLRLPPIVPRQMLMAGPRLLVASTGHAVFLQPGTRAENGRLQPGETRTQILGRAYRPRAGRVVIQGETMRWTAEDRIIGEAQLPPALKPGPRRGPLVGLGETRLDRIDGPEGNNYGGSWLAPIDERRFFYSRGQRLWVATPLSSAVQSNE